MRVFEKCKREFSSRPRVSSRVRQNGGNAIPIAVAIKRRRSISSDIVTENSISNISSLLRCWIFLIFTLF